MLSTSESAVYDRQIRLWGLSSQAKLKAATVLIFGLSRVNVEIAKNLVLAGTNLVLVDSSRDERENMLTLLEPRADLPDVLSRTCAALSTLNPMASVQSGLVSEAFLPQSGVDVAVADWSACRSVLASLAQQFRGKLVVTLETSEGTLSISDFHDHLVAEESAKQSSSSFALPGRVQASSVVEAIAASAQRVKRRKEPELLEKTLRIMRQEEEEETADVHRVDFALAAVTGGLLAQEVVKKITGKDVPLLNSLCVDEKTMGAYVQTLGHATIDWLGVPEEDVQVVKTPQAATDLDLEVL